MGRIYDDFTVKNTEDVIDVGRKRITEEDVRQETASFLVDTGADHLFISPQMQEKLNLCELATKFVIIGGGKRVLCKVAGPAEVWWHDRFYITNVLIMPGQVNPVVGVLTLENLDLIVNPQTKTLEGANGDEQLSIMF
jgi:predicted aspartyl protease